jgi:hypothetical protein
MACRGLGKWASVVTGIGFVTSWAFYKGCYATFCIYCRSADWPGFRTRFADLTVNLLADSVVKATMVAALSAVVTAWAFGKGAKNYRVWATCAAIALSSAYAHSGFTPPKGDSTHQTRATSSTALVVLL